MASDISQVHDEGRVYAVHVRFERHPETIQPPQWIEPPLGLGRYHGGYEVIGQSADLEGLARWVLGFGVGAEVVGPEALRKRIAAEARCIATRYESGPSRVKER